VDLAPAANCAGSSRAELAATLCELLEFRRPNGRLKTRECRDLLEQLDAMGRIELPDKARGAPGALTPRFRAPIAARRGPCLGGGNPHLLGAPAEPPATVDLGERRVERPAAEPATASRFAFLGHPLDTASLIDLDPRMAVFSRLANRLHR